MHEEDRGVDCYWCGAQLRWLGQGDGDSWDWVCDAPDCPERGSTVAVSAAG